MENNKIGNKSSSYLALFKIYFEIFIVKMIMEI